MGKDRRMTGNILLLITAMIWGTAFVFQRTGMDDIGPMTFNAARMFLAAAAVSPLAYISLKKTAAADPDRKKNTLKGGFICGACLGAASIFQQAGLVYTTAGKAGFITAMYMLLVPVISFLFLKRKITWLVWLAVATGVAGMYLLCLSGKTVFEKGDALEAVCALLFSFHILCCDHFVKKADPVGISALQFFTAGLISAAGAVLFEQPAAFQLAAAAVPILYCGLVSGGVGYTLQIIAQKNTEPAAASLLMSLEAVFAAIAGALMLHERMSMRELTGCIVMFAAIIMVQIQLPEKRKDRV
ncbi:MAG: DMT family transporter [Lachnospiraceae bacterium]|nr:DMT family transporter [Lachnospiraceae bacterium]